MRAVGYCKTDSSRLKAPCAANALSYNIQSQTYNNCPEAVTELQSCVCTKNQNLASISTAISKSVSYSCGSTASEDQASAATVGGMDYSCLSDNALIHTGNP